MSLYMTVPDKEFYQEFGRLEGKVDQLLEQNQQYLRERALTDDRLRAVERSMWRMSGAAVVVSSLIGLLSRFFFK